MAASNLDACFVDTERWEGWHQFSMDPHDPGGATWCGLTQRAYDAWRESQMLPLQGVRRSADSEIKRIFHGEYWMQARCDDLPPGLDLIQFDCAINEGAVQATKDLQRALGVPADGVFGLETLGAVQSRTDVVGLINAVCDRRESFWRRLTTFRWFGKGWLARGEDMRLRAINMYREQHR